MAWRGVLWSAELCRAVPGRAELCRAVPCCAARIPAARARVRACLPAEHGDSIGWCIEVVREELEVQDTSICDLQLNRVKRQFAGRSHASTEARHAIAPFCRSFLWQKWCSIAQTQAVIRCRCRSKSQMKLWRPGGTRVLGASFQVLFHAVYTPAWNPALTVAMIFAVGGTVSVLSAVGTTVTVALILASGACACVVAGLAGNRKAEEK